MPQFYSTNSYTILYLHIWAHGQGDRYPGASFRASFQRLLSLITNIGLMLFTRHIFGQHGSTHITNTALVSTTLLFTLAVPSEAGSLYQL